MSAVLLKILVRIAELLMLTHLGITKLIAFPTAKRKDGKTKSVGVKPCHLACCKGAKVMSFPGVLTTIIRQMVIPLKTSRARNRFGAVI
jgi:hypothetical protein